MIPISRNVDRKGGKSHTSPEAGIDTQEPILIKRKKSFMSVSFKGSIDHDPANKEKDWNTGKNLKDINAPMLYAKMIKAMHKQNLCRCKKSYQTKAIPKVLR